MVSKMPRWIWIGASLLAFIAGMINAVGFLGFQHQGITHLTGTTTLISIELSAAKWTQAAHLFGIIIAFVGGSALSGFVVGDGALTLGRRYGVALAMESALLFSAVPLLLRENAMGDYLASCACGLQNAMVSTYSGAVLRTTHVSGVFTDVGIFFGHLLRGLTVDWKRFRLWSALLGSFGGGGIVGAALFKVFGYTTLMLPAALTGAVGLSYTLYTHNRHLHSHTPGHGHEPGSSHHPAHPHSPSHSSSHPHSGSKKQH